MSSTYPDAPYCEICGEEHATCQTLECGMCDDCFERAAREALAPLMGKTCCNVWRQPNGFLAICLAPNGTEHMHGSAAP